MSQVTEDITFQSDSLELATRIYSQASRVAQVSAEHARSRGSNVVAPEDVKAALEDLLRDINHALSKLLPVGSLAQVEYTDQDLARLSRLPFRVPDVSSDADADL